MIKRRMVSFLKYFLLISASVISIFPLYFMVVSSFNSSVEVVSGKLYPGTHFLENAQKLFMETTFLQSFWNSARYTIVGTFVSVLMCSVAGYGFEVYHDKWKDRVMFLFLLSIMVPGAATLIPLFTLYSKIGLLNTMLGFIMPSFATAVLVLLFRQSARSFPGEIVDAARIDGLGEVKIYFTMFIPIMKSTFSCGIIISLMGIWNDYLWGLIIMQAPKMRTLQVFLASLNDGYSIDYGLMMLAVTLSTLPLALIFFFLQKTFIESVAGSVK